MKYFPKSSKENTTFKTWRHYEYTIIYSSHVGEEKEDTAVEPAGEPAEEASTEPSEEPAGEPSGEASTEPAGEPAGEASTEPVGEASTEPSEEPAELSPTSTDLVGTWVGPCFPSADGLSFNQLTFEFTETTWDLDYASFGDDACTMGFMTVNIAGDYTLEGASEVVEGARDGTFGFTTKTTTGHSADAAAFIDTTCETTGTEVDVAFDLSGGCAGLGAYPIADCAADYDIVKLNEDGTLSFGARPADNDMCTPEKRPTSFEGGAVVTNDGIQTY